MLVSFPCSSCSKQRGDSPALPKGSRREHEAFGGISALRGCPTSSEPCTRGCCLQCLLLGVPAGTVPSALDLQRCCPAVPVPVVCLRHRAPGAAGGGGRRWWW